MQPWLDLARVHAPLLIVLIPLCGAALAVAIPSTRLNWLIACAAALASTCLAADLLNRFVLAGGALPLAQEGVALTLDGVAAFALPLLAGAGALTMIAAGALLNGAADTRAAPFALALGLCMIAGWSGALLAADFVGLFLAVETAWLASVGLVALSGVRDRGALSGALRMLSAGGVAAALMLLGIGLIDRSVGSIEMSALAGARIASPDLASVGVGLIVIALALKAGIAPLHVWIGAAYGRAGPLAALALGVIGGAGALCVLSRVAVAAVSAPAIGAGIATALAALGVVSVAIGSIQAVGARNVRRLAAYAGAAQAGCILVSLALGSPAGIAAALVQIFAFAAAALALLGGAGALTGSPSLAALDGFARRAPLASAAIMFGALSLMGAPLTAGFLGRWRLIEAGVGGGWWWTAATVIFASLAAVFYGGRLIERLYFRRASATIEKSNDFWRFALAPALLAAIACVALGLEPSLLLRAANVAAQVAAP
jgi:formate hydrogenlyase subunit 3/multisubunit Na+/H+ antiporter MnhD subunit